jgi:16S rRNA (guanine527-N7)-methyltransferase
MDIDKLLTDGLAQLAIKADETVINNFETYLHELKKWNKAYNLTSLVSDKDIVVKHFLDSLLYLKAFPSNPPTPPLSKGGKGGLQVCDAGSGAGFPGLPIAIVRPEISITLVEPTRKKCAFLRNIKRVLGLDNVVVLESRIEDLKDTQFDIVMTRALFDTAAFVKTAGRLVTDDGCLLLSKGPKFEEELKSLPKSVRYEVITVPLPTTSIDRNLIRIYPQATIKHA